jgi:hypothetical protein
VNKKEQLEKGLDEEEEKIYWFNFLLKADDARKSDCSLPSRPMTSTDVVSRLANIDIAAGDESFPIFE